MYEIVSDDLHIVHKHGPSNSKRNTPPTTTEIYARLKIIMDYCRMSIKIEFHAVGYDTRM